MPHIDAITPLIIEPLFRHYCHFSAIDSHILYSICHCIWAIISPFRRFYFRYWIFSTPDDISLAVFRHLDISLLHTFIMRPHYATHTFRRHVVFITSLRFRHITPLAFSWYCIIISLSPAIMLLFRHWFIRLLLLIIDFHYCHYITYISAIDIARYIFTIEHASSSSLSFFRHI